MNVSIFFRLTLEKFISRNICTSKYNNSICFIFSQYLKMVDFSCIMSPNCKTISKERRYSQMSLKMSELQNTFENLNISDKVSRRRGRKHEKIIYKKYSTEDGLLTRNLDQIAEYLLKSSTRKVVVMAGAGISTPSGIADFRSPGTGLYHNIQKYNLPYPEAIFDIDYFYMDQRPFFALAKEIYPGNFKPNIVHYFARLLHEKNKLLRMYTQNIDGLERISGIPLHKLVEAHGTFATASCLSCHTKYKGETIKEEIFANKIPKCKQGECKGIVKPDIVFFGEQLPEKFWYHMKDMKIADLLIVMGTSLTVEPFASVAEIVPQGIPRLLINRDNVGYFSRKNDVIEEGDVAEGVGKLVKILGWESDLAQLIEDTEK